MGYDKNSQSQQLCWSIGESVSSDKSSWLQDVSFVDQGVRELEQELLVITSLLSDQGVNELV